MSEFKIIQCRYGRKCRTRNCKYDHSAVLLSKRRADEYEEEEEESDDDEYEVYHSHKKARLDNEYKKQITHQKSLSEDDLKVYELQDLFPNMDVTKIQKYLALHNYDIQKCIENLFNSELKHSSKDKNNNNINNNSNTSNGTSNRDTNSNNNSNSNNSNSNNNSSFTNEIPEISKRHSGDIESPVNNTAQRKPLNSSPSLISTFTATSTTSPSSSSPTSPAVIPTTTTTTTTTTTLPVTLQDDTAMLESDPQNRDSLQCAICLENKKIDFMFIMQECGHGFCRDCVSGYFQSKINDKIFPIKCPNYGCKKEATELDMEMILDRSMIDKYAENSFRNAIRKNPGVFSCCPTPDCPYIFFYTTSDSPDFGCPTCKKRYCLNCRVAYHSGSTCEAYQKWSVENGLSDDLFGEFVRGHKFKQCAGCKHWVEKSEGCNHMQCTCGYEFCYKCGSHYENGCTNCAEGDDEDENEDENEDDEDDENEDDEYYTN